MGLKTYSAIVMSCLWIIMVVFVCCREAKESDDYNLEENRTPVLLSKSPMYRIYLEWILRKIRNQETLNSNEYQFFEEVMDKRDKGTRLPNLEAYFTYQINREKCINLGDEGCINGSIPGSGSDSGYLNGNNNPGK